MDVDEGSPPSSGLPSGSAREETHASSEGNGAVEPPKKRRRSVKSAAASLPAVPHAPQKPCVDTVEETHVPQQARVVTVKDSNVPSAPAAPAFVPFLEEMGFRMKHTKKVMLARLWRSSSSRKKKTHVAGNPGFESGGEQTEVSNQ